MNIKRHGAATVGIVAAGALLLAACGSNNNTGSGGSSSGPSGSQVNVACGGKQNLTGEGSTAQKAAMDEFIAAYGQKCSGQQFAYNATGSGAGVKQFTGAKVDIGGSDSPLDPTKGEPAAAAKRCGGNPAWDIPMVFGPVAVSYKLSGVTDLTLTPDVTAKIFSGAIKTWNDPAIKKINPSANLPSTPITVIYRSDQSGTTDNFQKYLGAAAPSSWTKGAGKTFAGGVGEGKEKSAGVADALSTAEGSIGYIEWSYAQSKKLSVAKIDSGAGPVALSTDSVSKAIDSVQVKAGSAPNDLVLDTKALYASKAAGVYPLVLGTYEIVCSKGYDADTAKAVKAFLTVAATDGQQNLTQDGYVPLPTSFQTKVLAAINAIS
ncbi:MAG: phosphate ABC transporter substrate-binding protein PstS [Sciscionella sp.]|nr:phosphate ABC transporter substrate-binding protein PstS [Sciscionella sp.]